MIGICAMLGLGLTLAGCGEEESATASPASAQGPVEVLVVEAWTSPIERRLRLVGSTRAVDAVTVTAEVTGTVAWIGFDDEAMVIKDQKLIELDDRRASADLRAAEARLERLSLRLDRTRTAFDRGAANPAELDDARTAVAEAEAERDRAEAVHQDHTIRAPFAGRVTRRLVSMGALVSPGDTVAVLNSVDPIEVAFSVPERALADLRIGLDVKAQTAAFGDKSFDGELAAIGAEIDPVSRAADVFARVENRDGLLRPGMFVNITLVTGVDESAVLVPESALVIEGNRIEAFVVEDGKATRRRVRLASRMSGLVEIADGIEAGEVVVTSGVQKLREGTPVSVSSDETLAELGVIPGKPLAEQPIMTESGFVVEPVSNRGPEFVGENGGG
ncbi:MAG: efflux RND transporter periplasmic adaptor subunit [Phycisphaerales bacterium]|nr:efflux RND transporter periplasmic adaptor subunit [Phycisphaerales bacterium]